MSLGRFNLKQRTGRPVRLTADGYPKYAPIGFTVAWGAISAAVSDTVLPDDTPIFVGEKYLRYGTAMVPITQGTVQTVTISGSPTGGTFALKLTRLGRTRKTAALAYNISAADLKAALERLDNLGEARIDTVALASGVYTITFSYENGRVPALVTSDVALLGGSTPAVAVAVTTAGSLYAGQYVPYDSSGNDGRQTLTRGKVWLVDHTVKEAELSVMGANLDNAHMGGLIGGLIWGQRVNLINGLTLNNLLAVMPELRLTPNQ